MTRTSELPMSRTSTLPMTDGDEAPVLPRLLRDAASKGPTWLPLGLVLGAFVAVAYADHLVVSTSLVYLYILPLGVGAIFLRREISYSLMPCACCSMTTT